MDRRAGVSRAVNALILVQIKLNARGRANLDEFTVTIGDFEVAPTVWRTTSLPRLFLRRRAR